MESWLNDITTTKETTKKESKTRTLLHTYVHEFQGERRIDHPLKSHTR